MPSSHIHQITDLVEMIVASKARSILDIGVGWGTYGFLSRLYLDVCDGRNKYRDWKCQIEGVEVFKEYITPVHDFVYNKIHIGNATDVIPSLKDKYDLTLLIDVLEHFTYEEGLKLLNDSLRCSRNVLVSTPKEIGPQKDIYDNQYETHRFQWQKRHFRSFKNRAFVFNNYSLICCIGQDANKMVATRKKIRRQMLVKQFLPQYIIEVYRRFKYRNTNRS